MILADRIHDFVLNKYIEPARSRGNAMDRLRSSDVQAAIELENRTPTVYSALDAEKFSDYTRVQLVQRDGPHQGASAEWVSQINDYHKR